MSRGASLGLALVSPTFQVGVCRRPRALTQEPVAPQRDSNAVRDQMSGRRMEILSRGASPGREFVAIIATLVLFRSFVVQ